MGLSMDQGESQPSWARPVGIFLAIASASIIGASTIFTKMGLLQVQAMGHTPGKGHAYLKTTAWWIGMVMMGLGEIANFASYAFLPAILVAPLGALSVVLTAILSTIFLKERLDFSGKVGCAQCLIGATIIVINAPSSSATSTIPEFFAYVLSPGFLTYSALVALSLIVLIFYLEPRYGRTQPMVYITISSFIGAYLVMAAQGIGSSIVHSVQNWNTDNQFLRWPFYPLLVFMLICIIANINFLNKALALFSTAVVTPIYYVFFSTATLVSSAVLFQGFPVENVSGGLGIVMGFLVIVGGVSLLFQYNLKLRKKAEAALILSEADGPSEERRGRSRASSRKRSGKKSKWGKKKKGKKADDLVPVVTVYEGVPLGQRSVRGSQKSTSHVPPAAEGLDNSVVEIDEAQLSSKKQLTAPVITIETYGGSSTVQHRKRSSKHRHDSSRSKSEKKRHDKHRRRSKVDDKCSSVDARAGDMRKRKSGTGEKGDETFTNIEEEPKERTSRANSGRRSSTKYHSKSGKRHRTKAAKNHKTASEEEEESFLSSASSTYSSYDSDTSPSSYDSFSSDSDSDSDDSHRNFSSDDESSSIDGLHSYRYHKKSNRHRNTSSSYRSQKSVRSYYTHRSRASGKAASTRSSLSHVVMPGLGMAWNTYNGVGSPALVNKSTSVASSRGAGLEGVVVDNNAPSSSSIRTFPSMGRYKSASNTPSLPSAAGYAANSAALSSNTTTTKKPRSGSLGALAGSTLLQAFRKSSTASSSGATTQALTADSTPFLTSTTTSQPMIPAQFHSMPMTELELSNQQQPQRSLGLGRMGRSESARPAVSAGTFSASMSEKTYGVEK
ncbi:hypothetical protein HDV05_008244 [Chytridiales sp. JEL 0842]|nr:hypothetical protein HDV05_008244 [Chytridiales sp. JEL 0842]